MDCKEQLQDGINQTKSLGGTATATMGQALQESSKLHRPRINLSCTDRPEAQYFTST